MGKHSKLKKGIGITVLCILPVLSCLWGLEILPWTWRWYISYGSFYQAADKIVGHYPKKLPSSVENVSYYYYTGMFDTKTAVSFILDEEQYKEQKEQYLLLYTADEEEHQKDRQEYLEECQSEYGEIPDWAAEDNVQFVFGENVTSDFLEEDELDYLDEIFHDTTGQYMVLAYTKGVVESGERNVLHGVFCNDKENEIVIFAFTDAFHKEKHRQLEKRDTA